MIAYLFKSFTSPRQFVVLANTELMARKKVARVYKAELKNISQWYEIKSLGPVLK